MIEIIILSVKRGCTVIQIHRKDYTIPRIMISELDHQKML